MSMEITMVKATWIDKDEEDFGFYKASDIEQHDLGNGDWNLRFRLSNEKPGTGEDPFEVIISFKENGKQVIYRADCYEDPSEEYPLTAFQREDEMILTCDDKSERIFFHLS